MPFVSAPYDADSVVNSAIEFIWSRQSKWGMTWCFWSYDAIGIGNSIMWCWSSMAPLLSLCQDDWNKMQYNFWSSSMAHNTDASISTSTGTKSHITPLNNHLTWQMLWYYWWHHQHGHDRKHAIDMYMPKITIPLKCHILSILCNIMPISLCAQYDNDVSICASCGPTAINMTRNTGIHTFNIICIFPLNKYACHIVHICSTTLLLYST